MEIPLESFGNPLENLRRAFNEERSSSILPRRKRSPMHQKRKGFPIPAKVESLPLHQGEDKLTHPSKKEELTNALERKSPPIPPRRVPPSAPRSRQAHQSAARREELTNALKRKSLPIPPKREPHPMHQVEVKPTRCTKEGTSSPIPPRSYHSIVRFLLDYHVAINFNTTKVSL